MTRAAFSDDAIASSAAWSASRTFAALRSSERSAASSSSSPGVSAAFDSSPISKSRVSVRLRAPAPRSAASAACRRSAATRRYRFRISEESARRAGEVVDRRQRRGAGEKLRHAVLTDHREEKRGERRQDRLGHGPPVEVGPAPAGGRKDAPQHDLLLPRQPRLLPRVAQVVAAGQVEQGGHLRLGLPGAHRDRIGLLAEGEPDRLDQEGLPRARLPRDHVQARGERDTDVLEDGQVADGELDQHRGGTVTALPTSAWCAGR